MVACRDVYARILSDEFCRHRRKPSETKRCKELPSCDGSLLTTRIPTTLRVVSYTVNTRPQTETSHIEHSTVTIGTEKPPLVRNNIRWHAGEWSEVRGQFWHWQQCKYPRFQCTATCISRSRAMPYQKRLVECRSSFLNDNDIDAEPDKALEDSLCAYLPRPDAFRFCETLPDCFAVTTTTMEVSTASPSPKTQFYWATGQWTEVEQFIIL